MHACCVPWAQQANGQQRHNKKEKDFFIQLCMYMYIHTSILLVFLVLCVYLLHVLCICPYDLTYSMYVWIYVSVCMYVYVGMYVYALRIHTIRTYTWHLNMCMYTYCTYIHMDGYTYVCTYVHTILYLHICIRYRLCMYVCMYYVQNERDSTLLLLCLSRLSHSFHFSQSRSTPLH